MKSQIFYGIGLGLDDFITLGATSGEELYNWDGADDEDNEEIKWYEDNFGKEPPEFMLYNYKNIWWALDLASYVRRKPNDLLCSFLVFIPEMEDYTWGNKDLAK